MSQRTSSKRLAVSVIAASMLFASQPALAWSSDWSHTLVSLNALRAAAESYRSVKGDWPRDTPSATWYEAMDSESLISRYDSALEAEEERWTGPRDRWGHHVVYVPPAKGPPAFARPLLRSIGANGVDESGAGDDLVAGGTINPGFYGRPTETAFRRFALYSPLTLLLLVTAWRAKRRRFTPLMAVFAGLWAAVSCMIASRLIWPSRFGRGFIPHARVFDEIGRLILAITCAGTAAWFFIWVWRVGQGERRRNTRLDHGLCPACGYDLKGLPHARCPECGHLHPDGATPPPPLNPETP